MSFREFALSRDLAGSGIIQPFADYNKFFKEKAAKNAAWHVAHVITGIVVYPFAALAVSFGLLLNAISYHKMCNENHRNLNTICDRFRLIHPGNPKCIDKSGAVSAFSESGAVSAFSESGALIAFGMGSPEEEYLRINFQATQNQLETFLEKLRNLVNERFTKRFIKYHGVVNDVQRFGADGYHNTSARFAEHKNNRLEPEEKDPMWRFPSTRIVTRNNGNGNGITFSCTVF